jgi:hypothetical protein
MWKYIYLLAKELMVVLAHMYFALAVPMFVWWVLVDLLEFGRFVP